MEAQVDDAGRQVCFLRLGNIALLISLRQALTDGLGMPPVDVEQRTRVEISCAKAGFAVALATVFQ